jgi:ADP-heptose:LPS heptosyltransferase
LSRTDSIGDVVLTLPMAGFIKSKFPNYKIIFLGRTYTKPVVALSQHVDEFLNYDDFENKNFSEQKKYFEAFKIDFFVHVLPNKKIAKLAKQLKIKNRVGTTNRLYHWFTCNKLIPLSRKNSTLHESQLNLKLLSFLNLDLNVELKNIPQFYGVRNLSPQNFSALSLIDKNKINVILHPKSKGSAKEWGLENFSKLIELLPEEKFKLFISGTKDDAIQMQGFLNENKKATDITGLMNLTEFIFFISQCHALVAASTGPLHIAAMLNKLSIGLFSSKRPMHPGRWGAVGLKAKSVVNDKNCEACSKKLDCDCIKKIEAEKIVEILNHEFF